MLIGAHVSTAGGLLKAVERAERARLRGDPDLQPEPADVAADATTPRRTSPRSARRCDGLAGRGGDDPRGLPDQPRRAATGRCGEVAGLADPRAPGRRRDRRRSASSSTPARSRRTPATTPRKRAIGELISEALAETETCPIMLREHRRAHPQLLGRDFDETAELIEQTAAAKRTRASASTAATCTPPATTSRTPEGVGELVDEIDAKVGLERLAPPRQRLARRARAPTATATPTIGKGEIGAHGIRDVPVASRASRACRRCSRRPGSTATGPTARRCSSREAAAARGAEEAELARAARSARCGGRRPRCLGRRRSRRRTSG